MVSFEFDGFHRSWPVRRQGGQNATPQRLVRGLSECQQQLAAISMTCSRRLALLHACLSTASNIALTTMTHPNGEMRFSPGSHSPATSRRRA